MGTKKPAKGHPQQHDSAPANRHVPGQAHDSPPLLSAPSHPDHPTAAIWAQIKQRLPQHLEPAMIAHYINSLEVSYQTETVVLEVPNVNYYQGLVDHVLPVLNTIRTHLKASIHFSIQIRRRLTSPPAAAGTTGHPRPQPHQQLQPTSHPGSLITKSADPVFTKISAASGMNKQYTFANYIKGPSNQFCYAICQNIVQHPGTTYNPLFIYGFSGLGKTHLLHAVGNALTYKTPHHPVILTTTDNFMSELIYCIRHNKQHKFKAKYQKCSALLVDDIQFISGKKATQEEFFHVFNFLYERKIQIIITSDKYPHEIPDIEERLRNRFEWGLISDIQPPDQEHRMAIVYAKAEDLGVSLNADVTEYIASRWSKNVRELEGALRRVVAHASFHHQPINLNLVHNVFRPHSHEATSRLDIPTIQATIAAHYGLSLEELTSKKRARKIALPRQIGFYLARELTQASFPEIGAAFGGKDHSTVMHGVKKVTASLRENSQLRMELSFIQKNLKQSAQSPPPRPH